MAKREMEMNGQHQAAVAARGEAGVAEVAALGAVTKVPVRADVEVVPGPRRRTFTAEFKQRILAEVEACARGGGGEVGALLRKHGLYSSHLSEWRRQRDEGLTPKKRGRKASEQRGLVEENAKLKREMARLELRLEQAEVIISFQKKVSEVLGIPLRRSPSDEDDS